MLLGIIIQIFIASPIIYLLNFPLSFFRRFIVKRYRTTTKGLRLYEFENSPVVYILEQRQPASGNNRVNTKLVLVNQIEFHELDN